MEGSMHPQSRQAESLGAMQDELLRLQDLLRRRQQQRSPPRQRSRSRQSTTPRPSPSAPSLTEPPSPLSPWDLLHDEEGPENERSLSPTPWPYQPPAPPPPPPPTPPAAPPFVAGEPPRVVAPPPWMRPTPKCPPPEPAAAAGRRGDGNSNSSQTVHIIEAVDTFMGGCKFAWDDLSKVATKAFEDLDKQRQVAVDDLDKERQVRQKTEMRNAELEKRTQCVMCMDNERSVMFQPCFHLVSCTSCQHEVGICPVCRETIYGRLEVRLV